MSDARAAAVPVTVLMACYNGARWLDEAIGSVLGQTLRDFEFVIVDDGSTDDSPRIIAAHAARDRRIVSIRKANSGLADSLNVGIRQARGQWIARIDADDICEPARLERQLQATRRNPQIVFVGSSMIEIDDIGSAVATYRYPTDHQSLLANLLALKKFPPHSSALFRTSAARAMGGYRVRLKRSQDSDLWLRLSEQGQMTSIDAPLVRVRKHDSQISHEDSGRRQRTDARIAITSYWIRRLGCDDPVDGPQDVFFAFREWVEGRMEKSGFFDYLQFVAVLRERFKSAATGPAKALTLFVNLARRPSMAVRFFRNRVLGKDISRSLAREWVRTRGMPKSL